MIRTTFLFNLGLRCLCHGHICRVEHILDEYTVADGGIVNENMGHGADELTVLQNGRA